MRMAASLIQRPTIAKKLSAPRLAGVREMTAPLAAYYKRLGRLDDVDASQSVDKFPSA